MDETGDRDPRGVPLRQRRSVRRLLRTPRGPRRADRRASDALPLHRVRDRRRGYLQLSWHPSTRPARLDLDEGVRWLRLDIIARSSGGPFDTEGVVEFEAIHRDAAGRGVLHERSRSSARTGWYYVDGDVS
jgi:SEC-C motif-containing protein